MANPPPRWTRPPPPRGQNPTQKYIGPKIPRGVGLKIPRAEKLPFEKLPRNSSHFRNSHMQIGPPRALNREGLLSSCEQHSYYLFGRLVWVVLAHPVRLVRAPAVGQPWNYDKLFDDLVQHVQGDFEELALVYQDQPPGAL